MHSRMARQPFNTADLILFGSAAPEAAAADRYNRNGFKRTFTLASERKSKRQAELGQEGHDEREQRQGMQKCINEIPRKHREKARGWDQRVRLAAPWVPTRFWAVSDAPRSAAWPGTYGSTGLNVMQILPSTGKSTPSAFQCWSCSYLAISKCTIPTYEHRSIIRQGQTWRKLKSLWALSKIAFSYCFLLYEI